MARRLVEAGVPFITVFWSEEDEVVSKKCASGGGWDTHAANFACLRDNLLPEFDRASRRWWRTSPTAGCSIRRCCW